MSSDLAPEVVVPLLARPPRHGRTASWPECESTQRLLGADEPEGATVATDHQTGGTRPARTRLGGRSGPRAPLLGPAPPDGATWSSGRSSRSSPARPSPRRCRIDAPRQPPERRDGRRPQDRGNPPRSEHGAGAARDRDQRQPDGRRAARGHGQADDVAADRDRDRSGSARRSSPRFSSSSSAATTPGRSATSRLSTESARTRVGRGRLALLARGTSAPPRSPRRG